MAPPCPACASEVPVGGRFCPGCGAPLRPPNSVETGPYQPAAAPTPPAAWRQRFAPGEVLAGRYRVVALLGRGGMGEVYRADDLTLGQAVALKFLPEQLAADPDRLERFRREVRVARQVSHPNVCRVYDIGEADGQPFLTMEYIDGQDLAALLRQVGRLPEERGIELARQLCLGLAAAHNRGVLHRDLKPHNVMLDGRGQARLTDFGLAGFADTFSESDLRAGTPAYMAPEQLAGQAVSAQSDLFALGLVLYEMFTGKKAFPALTPEDLRRRYDEGTPSKPSSHVSGLNPAVERAVLRCLERDPKDRPRSAYEVVAALPGGDPLAAALAAGETPSPEMVANAPVAGSLPLSVAAALLAFVLLGLAGIAALNEETTLARRVPLDTPPQVLVARARDILKQLGYTDPPADSTYKYFADEDYFNYVRENDTSPNRWDGLDTGQPAAMYFWYVQGPRPLDPTRIDLSSTLVTSRATPTNPPLLGPGMAHVFLDLKGRLLEFQAVVAQDDLPDGPVAGPDWGRLFAAAGLDLTAFQPQTKAHWESPVAYDHRGSWRGGLPGRPDVPVWVEAAARGGRPVYFQVVTPWSRPNRLFSAAGSLRVGVFDYLTFALTVLALLGGMLLAWRNVRLGRADVRGACRVGLFLLGCYFLFWLTTADHSRSYPVETALALGALGYGLYAVAPCWLAYLALEPYVRRRWPWRITSWNRLLAGQFRDPLVGRDLLIGAAFGVCTVGGWRILLALPGWLDLPPNAPMAQHTYAFTPLVPVRTFMGLLIGTTDALTWFLLLFLLVLLCRKEWVAVVVLFLVIFAYHFMEALFLQQMANQMIAAAVTAPLVAAGLFVGLRYGVLPVVAGLCVNYVLQHSPIFFDLNTWYAGCTVATVFLLVAFAFYGFVVSLGGRPLFGEKFFQDA